MASEFGRQALELLMRELRGVGGPHAHNCGDTPSGRQTYKAATKRLADKPCVADFRLALTPEASSQMKTAACQWIIAAAPWSKRSFIGSGMLVRTIFHKCVERVSASEAISLLLCDSKLTDEQISWFAGPIISELGRVWATAELRLSAFPEQRDAQTLREWCYARLEQIQRLPNIGLLYVAACAVASTSLPAEAQDYVRCALEGISPTVVDTCFALVTPESDLEQLTHTVRLFLA